MQPANDPKLSGGTPRIYSWEEVSLISTKVKQHPIITVVGLVGLALFFGFVLGGWEGVAFVCAIIIGVVMYVTM
jgi:hypothetical protein